MTKKLRKSRIVTYSSTDRFPKTRATARRNRSKAKTWLLKDRGNARRSHAGSGRKTRNLRSQKQSKVDTPQAKLFPLTSATLPKWCTLKYLCTTSFSKIKQALFDHFFSKIKQVSPFKNQTSLPLFEHFSQKFSPLVSHAHIKPKICLNLPLKSCYAMNVMQRV